MEDGAQRIFITHFNFSISPPFRYLRNSLRRIHFCPLLFLINIHHMKIYVKTVRFECTNGKCVSIN